MANHRRGEIDAVLDGRAYRLCLTLGALAELESAFGEDDMLALATRFESGRISAKDACRIVGAGLRGAGHEISDGDVGRMQAEGGLAGFIDIVARLLGATFAGDERAAQVDGVAATRSRAEDAVERPFPGTR
ncbi:MAG TPA: gene transfer agent family protein [Hyphomicrobiaceae bacterium]|nr:gene transfer agent family protein [Hyphomicrobiaceae bacterium]